MMLQSRENEFWRPEVLWPGERAFVLASGPSMSAEIAERVRGRGRIIAVNSTVRLAPFADVFFFTDNPVFDAHREFIEKRFPGMVICLSRRAKRDMPDRIRRIEAQPMMIFPIPGSSAIRQGRSSGQTAISVARALGADEVVLLGFDMRVVEGRAHHHDDYAGRPADPAVYARDFLPAFLGWDTDAYVAGFRIVNATPGSALTEFPMSSLDEVLA